MKTWKLVSGILSIVLSVLVLFQSCAVGVLSALSKSSTVKNASPGSAGLFVSLLLLVGGIISIVTRNSKTDNGNMAILIIFALGFLIAFLTYGSIYSDLIIWGVWCAINAVLAIKDMKF